MTEQPMHLSQFGQPQQHPHRRRLIIVASVLALLVLAGGAALAAALGKDDKPATTVAAATAPTPSLAVSSAPPSLPGDAIAQETCVEVNAAYNRVDDLYKPEYVKPLGEKARRSSVTAVQDFGFQLVTKADLAAKNKGKDGEFSTTLEMSTVGTRFATWCLENGYIKSAK